MNTKQVRLDNYFLNNYHPKQDFFYHVSQKTHYIDYLRNNQLDKKIIKDADKICAHIFNLLGSGDRYLGEEIPWNEDFKTSFVWENRYYKDIKIVDLTNNADVKVPWEISRFQHLFTLGKAYWVTNDEKYALEFKSQIEQWIEKNPYENSVNWVCAMDVAIRAVNWITAYYFFEKSLSLDDVFWNGFNKSLYLHGMFILDNLENKGGFTSNHYISDVVGLIWLGLYFKGLGDSIKNDNYHQRWLEKGLQELENEMFIQICEDGACYEDSTSYHRLDCELFLFTTILCTKNQIAFSQQYMQRLEKMFDFIVDIMKPNGLVPFIGDADDGRLLILSHYYDWVRKDFRHILAIAGEYFDRDVFRHYGKPYVEDAKWIVGAFKEISINHQQVSKQFNKSGYYILRDNCVYCIVNAGQLSINGEGCHSHNDQLSFVLNVGGEDFMVDPGVFVYTADAKMRNVYRSTEVHNTLFIKGYEQNDFSQELFELKEETFTKCIKFSDHSFLGRHYGYQDKCGVIHERALTLNENCLSIEDKVLGQLHANLKIYRNFTLHPNVAIEQVEDGLKLINNGQIILLKTHTNEKIHILPGYFSNSYGTIINTKRIVIESLTNDSDLNIIIQFNDF